MQKKSASISRISSISVPSHPNKNMYIQLFFSHKNPTLSFKQKPQHTAINLIKHALS